MRWLALGALFCSGGARAEEVFLTEPQAPVALFGDGALGRGEDVTLTDAELTALSQKVQRRVDQRGYRIVEVTGPAGAALGTVLILDVVGKSLPIRFAVAVKPDGTLQDLQVMTYREPYGAEIKDRRFRAQFRGKTAADPLTVGKDLDAISGATISSVSAAYAVKKALALAAVLAARKS